MTNLLRISPKVLEKALSFQNFSAIHLYIFILKRNKGGIHINDIEEMAEKLSCSTANIRKLMRQLRQMGILKARTGKFYEIVSHRKMKTIVQKKDGTNKEINPRIKPIEISFNLVKSDGLKYIKALAYAYAAEVAIMMTLKNQYGKAYSRSLYKNRPSELKANTSASFIRAIFKLDISLTTIYNHINNAVEYGLIEKKTNYEVVSQDTPLHHNDHWNGKLAPKKYKAATPIVFETPKQADFFYQMSSKKFSTINPSNRLIYCKIASICTPKYSGYILLNKTSNCLTSNLRKGTAISNL